MKKARTPINVLVGEHSNFAHSLTGRFYEVVPTIYASTTCRSTWPEREGVGRGREREGKIGSEIDGREKEMKKRRSKKSKRG